jgi:hypothetical protein
MEGPMRTAGLSPTHELRECDQGRTPRLKRVEAQGGDADARFGQMHEYLDRDIKFAPGSPRIVGATLVCGASGAHLGSDHRSRYREGLAAAQLLIQDANGRCAFAG